MGVVGINIFGLAYFSTKFCDTQKVELTFCTTFPTLVTGNTHATLLGLHVVFTRTRIQWRRQPKILRGQNVDFTRATVFLFGTPLLKAKDD